MLFSGQAEMVMDYKRCSAAVHCCGRFLPCFATLSFAGFQLKKFPRKGLLSARKYAGVTACITGYFFATPP
jgi:hypothetical protein